jgi:hypothetical protein
MAGNNSYFNEVVPAVGLSNAQSMTSSPRAMEDSLRSTHPTLPAAFPAPAMHKRILPPISTPPGIGYSVAGAILAASGLAVWPSAAT